MLQKYGYTEGCEGCRAKAAGMTQKPHGEACRKRIEQALDGDEAGRELRRKNTERENQRIAEKMERDLGKRGDEPMAQEPEEAEAPAASSGGGQEEKMQEEKMQKEETTVMKTKRPMEDEETKAKRPRVEAEPKSTINSDIDMDEELNKLKMQSWNFMSMVKGYDFRREKDRQRFMRELGTAARCSFWKSEPIDAERCDELHDQSVQEASGEREVLCARTGPDRCHWGCTDDPACPRARISDHEAKTTTPTDHE